MSFFKYYRWATTNRWSMLPVRRPVLLHPSGCFTAAGPQRWRNWAGDLLGVVFQHWKAEANRCLLSNRLAWPGRASRLTADRKPVGGIAGALRRVFNFCRKIAFCWCRPFMAAKKWSSFFFKNLNVSKSCESISPFLSLGETMSSLSICFTRGMPRPIGFLLAHQE